jgi:hypothetical protein
VEGKLAVLEWFASGKMLDAIRLSSEAARITATIMVATAAVAMTAAVAAPTSCETARITATIMVATAAVAMTAAVAAPMTMTTRNGE